MDNNDNSKRARQAGAFFLNIALAAGLAAFGIGPIAKAHSQSGANSMKPIPIPTQVPDKDGVAQIPDTRLWYRDTGGIGVPFGLLHPATGSGLILDFQQPAFAQARYPGLAYLRLGSYNSAPFHTKSPAICPPE